MQIPFLAQALTAQYGEAVAAQIEQGMGEQRITTLRANLLKTTPEDVASVLSAAGIAYTRWAAEDAAFLLEGADERAVQSLPLYERGEIYLQSLSSMLPPLALAPQEGADILDMAAAPGGKTAQMAAMTGNRANITACEINQIRAEKLKYNLEKQGATRVNIMVRDAMQWQRHDPAERASQLSRVFRKAGAQFRRHAAGTAEESADHSEKGRHDGVFYLLHPEY